MKKVITFDKSAIGCILEMLKDKLPKSLRCADCKKKLKKEDIGFIGVLGKRGKVQVLCQNILCLIPIAEGGKKK